MRNMALHIMDIAQNCIQAQANEVIIDINVDELQNTTTVCIQDNGMGMEDDFLKKVIDPYTTSRLTRNVGLGIPLFKLNVERTGGSFKVESKIKQGTKVQAVFQNKHIDCIPLGDVPGVIMLLIGANPNINLEFNYHKLHDSFSINTREIKETLEDIPIQNPEVLKFIKEMIQENMTKLDNN